MFSRYHNTFCNTIFLELAFVFGKVLIIRVDPSVCPICSVCDTDLPIQVDVHIHVNIYTP